MPLRSVPLAAALLCCGCGPLSYTLDADEAERVVSEARAQNAAYYAPYELYFAEAHLDKAREEAAHGAYEEAIDLLSTAQVYGQRALDLSRSPGLDP